MKRRSATDPSQLGFDLLLAETDKANQAAALKRAVGHLPSSLEAALPYYLDLIARHHAAMLAGDGKTGQYGSVADVADTDSIVVGAAIVTSELGLRGVARSISS